MPKDISGGRRDACSVVLVDSSSRRPVPSASVDHGREIDNLDEVGDGDCRQ